jgi:hypothetical protein
MTEITNPLPSDPSGASTTEGESTTVNGAQSLLDAGSTGTEEGPGGIPASLVGQDKAGDDVDPPAAAQQGTDPGGNISSDNDAMSPVDTGSPQANSAGRGETAAGAQTFSSGR